MIQGYTGKVFPLESSMIFSFTPCPVCKGQSSKHVLSAQDNLTGFQGWFSIVRCLTCHTLYTQPTCSLEDIGYFYPASYGPYKAHTKSRSNTSKRKALYRAIKTITLGLIREPRYIGRKYLGQCNQFLDYGCSNGQYLSSLSGSFRRVGAEFNADIVSSLEDSPDLDIYHVSDCHTIFSDKQFQIITAWMVLEHLPNPTETLLDFYRWLDDSGCLAVSVPDASCLFRRFFRGYSYDLQVPTHITHFTPSTLCDILCKTGFSVLSLRYQPDSKTLLFSLAQFLEPHIPGSITRMRFLLSTNAGSVLNILLGCLLSILRLSSRIEIIAVKKHE